jgi:hypothetical protein
MRSVTKSRTQTISKLNGIIHANLNKAAYFQSDCQPAAVSKARS